MQKAAIKQSFLTYGSERLGGLCRGIGYTAEREREVQALFRRLIEPWGGETIGAPRWPSDITDDHSPFEFSLAMSKGSAELRILFEVQATPPSLRANWRASRLMNRKLEHNLGVSLGRLHRVEELFAPVNQRAKFAMWHAVAFGPSGPPRFRVYLNPEADGKENAAAIVEEAFARLGFGRSFAELPDLGDGAELKYFSLDLDSTSQARVKLYHAHRGCTTADIEAVLSCALHHPPGEAASFCRTLSGSDGPYTDLPLQTCLAFVEGHLRPVMGTVHFPVRSYSASDADAFERICQALDGDSRGLYRGAIEGFTHRRLDEGIGMQTYASLRQQKGGSRVTVYLSPEVHRVMPPVAALVSAPPHSSMIPASSFPVSAQPHSGVRLVQGAEPARQQDRTGG